MSQQASNGNFLMINRDVRCWFTTKRWWSWRWGPWHSRKLAEQTQRSAFSGPSFRSVWPTPWRSTKAKGFEKVCFSSERKVVGGPCAAHVDVHHRQLYVAFSRVRAMENLLVYDTEVTGDEDGRRITMPKKCSLPRDSGVLRNLSFLNIWLRCNCIIFCR